MHAAATWGVAAQRELETAGAMLFEGKGRDICRTAFRHNKKLPAFPQVVQGSWSRGQDLNLRPSGSDILILNHLMTRSITVYNWENAKSEYHCESLRITLGHGYRYILMYILRPQHAGDLRDVGEVGVAGAVHID